MNPFSYTYTSLLQPCSESFFGRPDTILEDIRNHEHERACAKRTVSCGLRLCRWQSGGFSSAVSRIRRRRESILLSAIPFIFDTWTRSCTKEDLRHANFVWNSFSQVVNTVNFSNHSGTSSLGHATICGSRYLNSDIFAVCGLDGVNRIWTIRGYTSNRGRADDHVRYDGAQWAACTFTPPHRYVFYGICSKHV